MDCVGILAIVSGCGCDYWGGGMSDRNSPTKLLQGPDVMAVHICEMCCSLPVCRQHSLSCPDISPSGGQVSSVVCNTYFQLIEGGEQESRMYFGVFSVSSKT